MAPVFKQLYPNCIGIIDCSEIFLICLQILKLEGLQNLTKKNKKTIKKIIGITPCGSISFFSKCWDGRVSDKVTEQSNFLILLSQVM